MCRRSEQTVDLVQGSGTFWGFAKSTSGVRNFRRSAVGILYLFGRRIIPLFLGNLSDQCPWSFCIQHRVLVGGIIVVLHSRRTMIHGELGVCSCTGCLYCCVLYVLYALLVSPGFFALG